MTAPGGERPALELAVPVELEPILAALYGEGWHDELVEYLAEQLNTETPAPGAPPVDTDRGEDELPWTDAGGPGRAEP